MRTGARVLAILFASWLLVATAAAPASAASPTGTIKGRATDAVSGAPAAGVTVTVYDVSYYWALSVQTGADGRYATPKLPAGEYTLRYTSPAYVTRSYGGDGTDARGQIVSVAGGAATTGVDVAMTLAGRVTGVVRDAASGAPLDDVTVSVTDAAGGYASAMTNAQGAYSLTSVAAGSARVSFVPPSSSPYGRRVASLTVTGGAAARLDQGLTAQALVRGHVTSAADGSPIADAYVGLVDVDGQTLAARLTDGSGNYSFGGLTAGAYRVAFSSYYSADGYAPQFYAGRATLAEADVVTTSVGHPGVANAVLSAAGRIQGTVTDASTGAPVPSVNVSAVGATGTAFGSTDANGHYDVGGLATGPVRLMFAAYNNRHRTQYYNNKASIDDADPIAVVAGQTKTGVNVALHGARIAGTVTDASSGRPAGGVTVVAIDALGQVVQRTDTETDGTYVVGALAPGAYRIRFGASVDPVASTGYALQWYHGVSGVASATPVNVTADQRVSGIDAAMAGGGRVQGRVTRQSTGAPLAGVTVTVSTSGLGSYLSRTATTAADGTYSVGGLPAASYQVGFIADAVGAISGYYNNRLPGQGADLVQIMDGGTVAGIDAQLADAGQITGRVTDAVTHAGLGDVYVEVRHSSGSYFYAQTAADGSYTVGGMRSGTARVLFRPPPGYAPQYNGGAATEAAAPLLSINQGSTLSGVDAAFPLGLQVTGRVTEAGTGAPLVDALVRLYDASGVTASLAYTDGAGRYAVSSLTPGTYRAQIVASGHQSTFYNNATTLAAATPITVSEGHSAAGVDVVLATGATIAGTVTDAALGAALPSVSVTVTNTSTGATASASTDAEGRYLVGGLEPGSYRVGFATSASYPSNRKAYVDQYYSNATTVGGAQTITLTAGQARTGVDAAMLRAGSIEGTLTDAVTHQAAGGVSVVAYNASGATVASTTSESDGSYVLSRLPAGQYRVGFATTSAQRYVAEYHQDAATLSAATAVAVSAPQRTTGIDAALAPLGSITGTVRAADGGAPLAGVPVIATGPGGTTFTTSEADGRYRIDGLTTGTYSVSALPGTDDYVQSTYPSGVQVTTGQVTPGIDLPLAAAGRITGTVTDAVTHAPISDLTVRVTPMSGSGGPPGGATTGADGSYDAGGLAPGTYRVEFVNTGTGPNYADTYYNGKAYTTADPVTVAAGRVTTGIDAALAPAGEITGRVTDARTSQALSGIAVEAFDGDGNYLISVRTQPDGSYRLRGLATGDYRIAFFDVGGGDHVPQFYDGQPTIVTAAAVHVVAGQSTAGIDAALASGGSISGRVTDASTGAPLPGVTVTAQSPGGSSLGAALTDADGRYTLSGVASGQVVVRFLATGLYASKYYNNKDTAATADRVTVSTGVTTSGIDAALPAGGVISGTVTGVDTGGPLLGVNVHASAEDGSGGWGYTDSQGRYKIEGLDSGTYTVTFLPGSGQNYLRAPYESSVSVSDGQTTAGVDAALAVGGRVTGTVTDAVSHAPISGVSVIASSPSDTLGSSYTTTDQNGHYSVGGLPTGSVTITATDQQGLHRHDSVTVTATVEQTVGGADIALEPTGVIAGHVTARDTGAAVSWAGVEIVRADGTMVASTYAYAGSFRVGEIPAGTYKVRFTAGLSGVSYGSIYYPAAGTLAEGTPVTVTAGAVRANVDGALFGPPVSLTAPTVSGTAKQGEILTAGRGSWSQQPDSYTYRWLRCTTGGNCTTITGATEQTYKLTNADAGLVIRVQETATNAAGSGAPATSAATAVVIPLPPVNADLPAIAGIVQQGQTITAQDGNWTNTPTSFTRQWLRCDAQGADCAAIAGATGATYVPVAADAGLTLAVTITASNAGGTGVPATSLVTVPVVQPPPVIVSAPTITGTARQGATLTEHHGSWTNNPTSYTYQWQRCDALGTFCLAIPGASGQSYVPQAADLGATLRVLETAANGGVPSMPSASAASAVVVAAPPVSQSPPAISGAAQQGHTLTVAHGLWSNEPDGYQEQWLRCDSNGEACVAIDGATGTTYAVASADVGARLAVREVAVNSGGESAPASSSPTIIVTPDVPSTTGTPLITGTAQQGRALTAQHAPWANAPTSYTYQWQRCTALGTACLPVAGATGQTYVPVAADVGSTLVVAETAANVGGASAPAVSPATGLILSAPPVNQTPPAVSGTVQEGQTVTIVRGTWTNQPTGYRQQWYRCPAQGATCTAIAGATDASYVLTATDVGHPLAVAEIATNVGGDSPPATSARTAPVALPVPVSTSAPAITGDAQQGYVLTAQHGTWTNAPDSYTYHWRRCDLAGSQCVDIAGATAGQYTPVADDVGSTLVVLEIAVNAGGHSDPAASLASAAVLPESPAPLTAPAISGIAQQGQPLLLRHGGWTNQPSSYVLQWLRCDADGQGCSAIDGATTERYVPVADDVGHRLAVTETARNAGGDSPPARSEATAVVLGPAPENLTPPTVTGTAEQGQALTAHYGSWSGGATAHDLQWKRCVPGSACALIAGATGTTYTVATADVGARLVVEEAARNGGAPSPPATSAPTAVVTVPALDAVAGDPQRATVGQDVAFDASASAPRGVIDGYQWDFGDGGSATGATAAHRYDAAGTYTVTLTITDAGHDATATTTVTVASRPPGTRVTVLAPGGQRVQGASLVYAAGDGTRTAATTGADGVGVLAGLPDGAAAVYVWAAGYRPAVAQVTVDGGTGAAEVTLTSGQIATSKLESHPMTLAEIEAAGIDPSDPSNQNVWNFEVELNFTGPTGGREQTRLCGHLNGAGEFVGQTGFGTCGGSSSGGGGGCGMHSCRTGGVTATGVIVNGHPLIQWLVLDAQVTTLKQFFAVDMIINNLSPEPFRLTGGRATLDLPGGLSLAPTAAPQAATRDVGEIAGLASADVKWIVRGDEPGRYGLTASYSGRLQPFDAPVDLSATLAEPLHVWGPEALGIKIQADAGTLKAGRPHHVRIGVTNRADVPFYNVALGIDPDTHDRFIFQPRERFEDKLGELSPGETTYGHVYVLVPDADSLGGLLPRMSRAAFAGQPVQPGGGVQAVTPPAIPDLKALGDTVGSVHLRWEAVPGAQGYEVYATENLDTPFGDEPDTVEDFGGNRVTRLPAGATDAFIPAEAGSARHYAVTAILRGRQTLSHPVVVGRPGVAPPAGPGGGVGGASSGGPQSASPGAKNEQGLGAPKPTCPNHSVQLGGVTVLASCFIDGPNGTLQARGGLRVNGFDLRTTGGFTLDRKSSKLTASGTVDGYLGSMQVYHGTFPDFSLKVGVGHTWAVPKGLKIKGLPATGSFSLKLDVNALTAEATAQIGNSDSAFAISGGIKLKATLADGLRLDGFHLELASDLPLKALVIKQASLEYKATSAGDQWSGKVGVVLPSGPAVAGSLTLLKGSVSQVGVNVSKINKPIGQIIYLQSLGLDVVLKPSLKATGSIGLTAGPSVLGRAAAALDGTLIFQLGPAVSLKASGTLKVVTMEVASASLSAAIPGGVQFSGDIRRGFPGFVVDAHLGGSIDTKSFAAEGGATAKVGPVSASGKALVDQLGVAACVSGSALGQTVNLGAGYKWKSGNTGLLDGACGFADLRKTIAHISAAGPLSVDVPADQRQVNLIVQGTPGTAPAVTVTRGSDQATIQPGTVGRLGSTVYLAVADPAGGRTGIVLAHPPAGRVTVAPVPGAPPVSVKATALLPDPVVGVKVRSLGHRRYRASWTTRRIPGQQLVFRETSGPAAQLLRRSSAARGSFTFTALDTRTATHAIQVIVDQEGLPRKVLRSAARFRVPRAVTTRPRVTIRQGRARATIRWTRVPRAVTYQVTIATADGRRLFFSRKASARSLTIPRSNRVTATVRGISGGGVSGPPGRAVSRTR